MSTTNNNVNEESMVLNLLCTPEEEAWRLYARPTLMPVYLRRCFDEHHEAFPVYLDLEDLDRHMQKRNLEFEKKANSFGDVELTARGRAAMELAVWLSRMFATGIRQESGAPNSVPGARGHAG